MAVRRSTSSLAPGPDRPLSAAEVRHREEFAAFARLHGEEWFRRHLDHLYELWGRWNAEFFAGGLVPPHLLLNEPTNPRAYGTHAPVSGWGSKNEIRIRPSLLRGGHPDVLPGDEFAAGRVRVVEDVLLHETVHQYHAEVTGAVEASYHGHGPAFAAECNRIGERLGLPPVRAMKRRGKDRGLPSCAQWPLNVRPAGYYLGAFVPQWRTEADGPAARPAGPSPDRARAELFRAAFVYGSVAGEGERQAWAGGPGRFAGLSAADVGRLLEEVAGRFYLAVVASGDWPSGAATLE